MVVKLVRFAHNWNNGMVESWNDGFKENGLQNTYPVFHHSMRLTKRMTAESSVGPIIVEIPIHLFNSEKLQINKTLYSLSLLSSFLASPSSLSI
jgi:hypothetical protein